MRYGDVSSEELTHGAYGDEQKVAKEWHNRRPICPYGCDEEGELVEIVMKEGRAIGYYKDSEQLVFTAELQMAPKPTSQKLVLGPDGEYQMVSEETVS